MKNRRFAIPAVCSIGLHAALIFGVRPPTPAILLTASDPLKPLPVQEKLIEELPPPMPKAEQDSDLTLPTVAKVGMPRPEILDTPNLPRPGDIVIDVAPPGPPAIGPFQQIGEGGVPWGKFDGTGAFGTPERIVDFRSLDRVPAARAQPSPIYPTEAKRIGISGEVIVDFVVGVAGEVTHVSIVQSTNPLFEGPARRAVERWRFEPGLRAGKPVAFRMRLPITFNINTD